MITIPILNYDSTPLKVPNTNWPPYIPTNPDPSDGAINVSIDADLSWNSGDPNFANTVIYDIYFGTTNPPPYLDTTNAYPGSQTRMAYSLESLNSNETYYWQIVAKDNNGESSTGPIWSFISNI